LMSLQVTRPGNKPARTSPAVAQASLHRAGRGEESATRGASDQAKSVGRGHDAAGAAANPARERMSRLLRADSLQDADELVRGLGDDDPFIRSAAISSLAKPVFRKRALEEVGNRNARRRLGAMLALRRAKIDRPDSLLEKLLVDPDEQLRRMALVWVGEEKLI